MRQRTPGSRYHVLKLSTRRVRKRSAPPWNRVKTHTIADLIEISNDFPGVTAAMLLRAREDRFGCELATSISSVQETTHSVRLFCLPPIISTLLAISPCRKTANTTVRNRVLILNDIHVIVSLAVHGLSVVATKAGRTTWMFAIGIQNMTISYSLSPMIAIRI